MAEIFLPFINHILIHFQNRLHSCGGFVGCLSSGYYFLTGLLLVLQALHIFWTWLILRMVHKLVFLGKVSILSCKFINEAIPQFSNKLVFNVERDERSDEESEAEEEEEEDEGGEEEQSWEQKKGALNSKLASLANNSLNNLTNQGRKMNSRIPKAR